MNISEKEFLEIESKLGYTFINKSFIKQALTHPSFVYEKGRNPLDSNQRLEFLGDAVLQIVISEILYNNYPDKLEGDLSKLRSKIVCELNLHKTAYKLKLGKHLILNDSEKNSGGCEKPSIQADLIEAIMGAIYLDSGIENAKKFAINHIEVNPQNLEYNKDYKSLLQEYIQKESKQNVNYQKDSTTGPAHSQTFIVSVWHIGKKLGKGIGQSRKKAEQMAAKSALEKLGVINIV